MVQLIKNRLKVILKLANSIVTAIGAVAKEYYKPTIVFLSFNNCNISVKGLPDILARPSITISTFWSNSFMIFLSCMAWLNIHKLLILLLKYERA